MASPADDVLIFYSNPPDTSRLRLHKEHRAIDQMLQRIGRPVETIRRMHASSVDDMLHALNQRCYRVVQFSGHGEQSGIVVEAGDGGSAQTLPVDRLQNVLSVCGQEPRAIILMSCYSTDILPALLTLSPYVITVSGAGDDDACIEFSTAFYETYLTTDSIETAFSAAQTTIYAKGLDLAAILSRRAQGHPPRALFQVFPSRREDSILVDISKIEKDIARLNITKDTFLKVLTQKIRVHRWLFQLPKEEAIIPLGPYFGVFTWRAPNDLVTCEKLLTVKPGTPADAISSWTAMVLAYNDLYVDRYRVVSGPPNPPGYEATLNRAIKSFYSLQRTFMVAGDKLRFFDRFVPIQFGITKGIIEHNLQRADEMLAQRELVEVVIGLETMLTTFHDLVTAVSDHIVE
jgi:hypothetical protein